ncbi:hypothetical protein LEP1GSC168_0839 [Leptospira santarosai str. HAI134]|nr:hypothetical protein LEP1GSC168_0839 [Leptospira santarosai str. HAI134]
MVRSYGRVEVRSGRGPFPDNQRRYDFGIDRVRLGSGIRILKKGLAIRSYFADSKSEEILLYEHFLEDPFEETIGNIPVLKGVSLLDFGKSSIVSSSIKKTAAGRLQFSNKAVLNPQAFHFDSLSAKIVSEDFHKTIRIISEKPPRSLGPRWAAENFYVLKSKDSTISTSIPFYNGSIWK